MPPRARGRGRDTAGLRTAESERGGPSRASARQRSRHAHCPDAVRECLLSLGRDESSRLARGGLHSHCSATQMMRLSPTPQPPRPVSIVRWVTCTCTI